MAIGKYERMAIKRALPRLIEAGKDLVRKAAETANVKEQTSNLKQSYVFVVAYDGIEIAYGDSLHCGVSFKYNRSHRGLPNTGWEKIAGGWAYVFDDNMNKHMRNVCPSYKHVTTGFELLILNTAYYAEFLESGSYAKGALKGATIVPREFRIISQIGMDCRNVQVEGLKVKRVDRIGYEGRPLKPKFY